jgi:hypothetical protein
MRRCTPGTSASSCLATQLGQFGPGASLYFTHYGMPAALDGDTSLCYP